MWKPERRCAANRSGLRYPNDLTDGPATGIGGDFRTAILHARRVKRGTPSTHPILCGALRVLRRLTAKQRPASICNLRVTFHQRA
jgi:hypothetical protein